MYIAVLFIIFRAMVYHYIGETEYENGVLLMVLSVMLAGVTFFVSGWGIFQPARSTWDCWIELCKSDLTVATGVNPWNCV